MRPVSLSSTRSYASRLTQMRIDPYVWLVLAFSLFALLPLAGPDYFFDAHDAPHSVFFLTEFDAALRDGVWYPGWGTDHAFGYGWPTFVFYPPLAYYAAAGFHVLGAAQVVAVKWIWALATVGAGLAMYAYARHVMGRKRALLAAIVYVYVPYHLADIYVRAALAEYCAFVWMPLCLLAFHRLAERATARLIGLAALSYGALWLTHNVTALAFTPLLAAYVLFRILAEPGPERDNRLVRWKDRLVRAAAALAGALLGLGIAATLVLPSLFERIYINQEQWVRASYDYALHFVFPFQLLSSFWGYGAAGPGPVDGMSFQLGAVPVILSLVATVSVFWRPARERALTLFFACATVLVVFLMLPVSAPIWKMMPIAALVQFPWRLLALTTVAMAILSGLAIPRAPDSNLDPRILVLSLVAILGSYAYTLPEYTSVPAGADGRQLILEFEAEYPDMIGMTAWTQEMPTTSPLVPQYRSGDDLVTAEALAPGATVEQVRAGGASDRVYVRSEEGTVLLFYTYYFPGWRVYVDGERLPEERLRPEGVYGLLAVDIPAGEHDVLLRWGDTPLRLVGKALTVGCLLLALALVVPWKRLGKRPPL